MLPHYSSRAHVQHSYELSVCAVVDGFLGILQKFSEVFSNNTAGGTFLILSDFSLKNSRTPFNSIMPGGDKRSYIRSQTSN